MSTDINRTKSIPRKEIILNSVITYFGISENELNESFKGKKNMPKMIAIYLLSHIGQLTHRSISEVFSTLKPSSISPQIIRLKKIIETDILIRQNMMDITNMIHDCT